MLKPRKKPLVYKESVKVRHTSHWDIDHLPLKEVDALYNMNSSASSAERLINEGVRKENLNRYFRRIPRWVVLLIGLLLFGRFGLILAFHWLS